MKRGTITTTLHKRAIMFERLKRCLVAWAERYQQRELKRLHVEGCRLKEEVMQLNGGKPISLSPEQRRLLVEKAKAIDPEVLKQISVFDFQDLNPQCPNDTSTESP